MAEDGVQSHPASTEKDSENAQTLLIPAVQPTAVLEPMSPSGVEVVITQPASVQDPAYHVVEPLPENLTPHNFLILSVIVAIICGIVSCTTLLCGCIAVAFSAQSVTNSKRQHYKKAKLYGNVAMGLSMAAVAWGFIGIIIAIGVTSQVFPGFQFPCICISNCQCPPTPQPNY